ncbi:MAG: DUF5719 family protein [Ornithinimicrobium sp.]
MSHYRSAGARALVVVATAAAVMLGAAQWEGTIQLGGRTGLGTSLTPGVNTAGGSAPVTPVDGAALVCPGPERRGLADSAVREGPQAVGIAAVSAPPEALPGDFPSTAGEKPADVPRGTLEMRVSGGDALATASRRGALLHGQIDTARAGVVSASGSLAPALSAAQIYLSDQDEQRGLALTSCGEPAEDSWLIAGGAQAGHAERLVLINPGRGPITAGVTVWGTAAEPGAGQRRVEVALEPGARQILLLDALAPGEAAPVVHVVANGGPVSAFLGDRLLEGTTDRGTELSSPVAQPATEQVIVGFAMPEPAADSATVRVAVPGPDQAVIEIRALTAAGSAVVAQDVTLVAAQRTADIDVSDLPADTYALQISSDEEFVAAAQVRSARDEQGRQDVAWSPGTGPLGRLAGSPLPQPGQDLRVDYAVDLFAPLGGTIRLITMDADGRTEQVQLDLSPGRVLAHDLESAAAVWVSPGAAQTYAAVRGELRIRARPARDANADDTTRNTTGDGDTTGNTAGDGDGAADRDGMSLISVLPLRELSIYRSVTTVTPALP